MARRASRLACQALAVFLFLQAATAIPFRRYANTTTTGQINEEQAMMGTQPFQAPVTLTPQSPTSQSETTSQPSLADPSEAQSSSCSHPQAAPYSLSITAEARARTSTTTSTSTTTAESTLTKTATVADSTNYVQDAAYTTSISIITMTFTETVCPLRSQNILISSSQSHFSQPVSTQAVEATQSSSVTLAPLPTQAIMTTVPSSPRPYQVQGESWATDAQQSPQTALAPSSANALTTAGAQATSEATLSIPYASPSTLTPISTAASNGGFTGHTSVNTRLETSGVQTSQPLLSFSSSEAVPSATVTTSLLTKSAVSLMTLTASTSHAPATNGSLAGIDPFEAIATNAPPSQVSATGNHPVPTGNIVAPQDATLQTNKFYANLFLGTGQQSAFTFPYTLNWVNGNGPTNSFGMAVQHLNDNQRVSGPAESSVPSGPVSYYTNGINLQQLVLGGKELGADTKLTADSLEAFSVNANLYPSSGSSSKITFPLVQGMGFATALYSSLQPEIQTSSSFSNVTFAGSIGTAYKYRASLSNGDQWLIYVIPDNTAGSNDFKLASPNVLEGPANWSGTIQVAKNPGDTSTEGLFDVSAGVYATSASLSGSVDGNNGQYTLTWNVTGQNLNNGAVLGYALPHMVESFSDGMTGNVHGDVRLQTTTKGIATAVTANSWTMSENDLPSNMTFTPWTPGSGPATSYSADAVNAIFAAAQVELSEDIAAQTDSNSMYYAGKAFSKFASILIAVNDICQEHDLAQQGLARLEDAFTKFISNQQQHPLVYDSVWKGVASSASYGGDSGADFGNTYYNDHHFHYGYFLHAAAVIAHLDPNWLSTGSNKDWVNALARDVSNPSTEDSYFPVFRSFDWFHGHSWAHGLYETADGKDQESSSEDVMFSYSLKLWGMVTGDKSMEARGNLMLAVQARSLQSYYLLEDDNKNQPANYIGNKVAGILFENKADHTTYFGTKTEYIQGIHMLPLIPASALTRTSTFVKQEWDTFFAEGATDPASQVEGGWKGVLYANLALSDPKASYEFFSSSSFDSAWLDGGASRTWYLAFAAGLGGSSA